MPLPREAHTGLLGSILHGPLQSEDSLSSSQGICDHYFSNNFLGSIFSILGHPIGSYLLGPYFFFLLFRNNFFLLEGKLAGILLCEQGIISHPPTLFSAPFLCLLCSFFFLFFFFSLFNLLCSLISFLGFFWEDPQCRLILHIFGATAISALFLPQIASCSPLSFKKYICVCFYVDFFTFTGSWCIG